LANTKVHEQDVQIQKLKYMHHDLENKYGDVSKEAIIARKTLEEEHSRNEIDKKLMINSVRS